MRTRGGIPTKKAIGDLCDKHLLVIYPLDSYSILGRVTFSAVGKKTANEKAKAVVNELRSHGFDVRLTEALPEQLTTGNIKINPKVD